MSDKDFLIEPQMRVPDGSVISAKPCYLVTMTEKSGVGKNIQQRRFVAIDLPIMVPSHIQTKGFYTDVIEDEIILNFKTIVQGMQKENIIELYLPWHSIISIRSLVFKAK